MIDVIYVCDIIHHFNVTDPRLRDKVRQRGSGAESRARALRADQGLYTQNHRAIVSQRGPEYASEWQ